MDIRVVWFISTIPRFVIWIENGEIMNINQVMWCIYLFRGSSVQTMNKPVNELYERHRYIAFNPFSCSIGVTSGRSYNESAIVRSSFSAEISLILTAISIEGTGIPRSIAFCEVHLPVPFCFALSRIWSIKSPSRRESFSAKISEKYLPNAET